MLFQVIKLIAKPNVQQNGDEQEQDTEDGGDVWQVRE